MTNEDIDKYRTPDEMWPCFNGAIFRAIQFIEQKTIYFEYLTEVLNIIANAKVQYVELRLV